MQTRLTEILKIQHPVMLAGMGGVSYAPLVSAVSEAGGFGCLGASTMGREHMVAEIAQVRQATDKPFGVDLLTAMPGDLVGQVEDIIKGGASVFVAGLGVPSEVVDLCHRSGVLVINMCGKVDHARRALEAGCDIVVAQGTEAGGHTGQVATMVLVPDVVDAVAPVPVLAAGGIARGRQIAASLALGAEGVWCGSVWLTTEEAETPPVVKNKFLAATSSDTVRSRSLTGKPARMLRTAWTDAWERADSPDPLGMPLQTALIDDPQRRINRAAARADSSAAELATYFVGQVVGSLNKVQPTSAVVMEMVSEFIDTVGRLDELVDR
jgi:NAD(P)H-dependent flavin oxidoreductase YrpB (nitropropane dioxygenase family)